jgi:hypothetical protein
MTWRFRCTLRFQAGSGLAAWCHAQNDVRLGMAHHLNEGRLDEERSRHDVVDGVYAADLILGDEALVLDTWDTLLAPSVTAWLLPDAGDAGYSWADVHDCSHEPGGPCPTPTRRWPT